MAMATKLGSFQEIDRVDVTRLTDYTVDDLIDYVHEGIGAEGPDYALDLYYKYLRQRWNVADIDFTQDRIDWQEKLTDAEREAFLRVATGFHHGEREVAANLTPLIAAAPREEQKIFLTSHLEDEARHTVFFDRFYKEAVGLPEGDVQATLDNSWDYVLEGFASAFTMLSWLGDQLRLRPNDKHLLAQYLTLYQIHLEGVGALSVMKITLSFCRNNDVLPGYYKGFLATCRDEARHVAFGVRMLNELLAQDPSLITDVHEMYRTIFMSNAVRRRLLPLEALGYDESEFLTIFMSQINKTLKQAGVRLSDDLMAMIDTYGPVVAGG